MKFLGLVLVLAYISACSAAANRSTLWLIADELIYTINGYQKCAQAAGSQNKTLVTTKYFTITSGTATTDTKYYATIGGTAAGNTAGGSYVLPTMQLSFVYGDNVTPNLVFTLPSFTSMSLITTNTFSTLASSIIAPGTYLNAYGTPWLTARIVNTNSFTSAGPQTGTTAIPTSVSVLITDYRSQSTILVTQYQDSDNTAATNVYNHFYSVIVRTFTSYLTTTTDVLVGGCTTTGRPATLTQVGSVLSTACSSYLSTAATSDSSFSSASTMCATSDTDLPDAVSLSIVGISSLRTADNAVFGAAGTKFTIAASFGFFIAMSSIFFNL